MSQRVAEFLPKQLQSVAGTSQHSYWVTFEELYNKKLYHQLTIKLLDYLQKESPQNLLEIYENFISDFELRIKPLSLVEIVAYVVKQIPNNEDKIVFTEKIKGLL